MKTLIILSLSVLSLSASAAGHNCAAQANMDRHSQDICKNSNIKSAKSRKALNCDQNLASKTESNKSKTTK